MNEAFFILQDDVIIVGPESAQGQQSAAPAASGTTQQATAPVGTAETAPPPSMLSMNIQLIGTMVLVFVVMYFFTIRPQKKREKELKEIQNSLQTGDWVVTFSGMYGKAVDVGADVVMVEFGTNKGVRIPVRKTELTKSKEPSLTKPEEEEAPAKK